MTAGEVSSSLPDQPTSESDWSMLLCQHKINNFQSHSTWYMAIVKSAETLKTFEMTRPNYERRTHARFLLWHAYALLGNDLETSKYTKVRAPQTSMFPRKQEDAAITEETFSSLSVPRCYNQDQFCSCKPLHHWRFSKLNTGPRFADDFQPTLCNNYITKLCG
jgi:hypothetical protein